MIGDAKSEFEKLQEEGKAKARESLRATSEENEFKKMQEEARARALESLRVTLKELEQSEQKQEEQKSQRTTVEDEISSITKKLLYGDV